MMQLFYNTDGGNGGKGLGGRIDPDTTHEKGDIVSTEGMDGTTKGNDDTFSDEGLDEPGGTSGADSGTNGLARDDD